ncbi:MAG: 4-hydroxy-3-methylbut-2-en-1-yl diphosphate synthase [Lachnospiraceae bacterium]|nr:4-hydroxy-3-methylbut-2-en-1-yl diphosphate synthase [Lachnospiraceae bacterium]
MNLISQIEDKIKKGGICVGTNIVLGDGVTTELLGCCGYDFLWVDMEHTQLGKDRLMPHFLGAQAAGKPVFVRVPWNDPVLIKPVLDMGIDAAIFPMIKGVEDAELAVSSCLYPPEGIRGYGPGRASMFGLEGVQEYIQRSGRSFWKIIQIEHVDALEHLEDIISVPGIDSVLIGPSDLSGSAGLLQQQEHPRVMVLYDEVAEVLRRKGMPFGAAVGFNEKSIREWVERGVSWLSIGSDAGFLMEAGKGTLERTKALVEERTEGR